MDLDTLVKTGKDILTGVKFVPSEPGVMRLFSVYKLQDRMAYSTWKNQAILFLQSIIGDTKSLKRFEDESKEFETHHYQPSHLENMIGVLDAYLQAGFSVKDKSFVSQSVGSFEKVFVVHGHNEAVNQEVARTLEKMGLEAIILREQPNSGQTIIEKFESYAKDVRFAIILLTADDKIDGEERYRARQNVIFEMGYFMGALGRKNVMCMVQDQVEKPGDIDGVVYTLIDNSGVWKFSMVKELVACGYKVDANAIL